MSVILFVIRVELTAGQRWPVSTCGPVNKPKHSTNTKNCISVQNLHLYVFILTTECITYIAGENLNMGVGFFSIMSAGLILVTYVLFILTTERITYIAGENLNMGVGFFSIMSAGLILVTYVLSTQPLQIPHQFSV